MRAKILPFVICALVLGAASSVSAQDVMIRDNGIFRYHESPRWRESESHPLRIVAYVLHPVGWTLREGIFRPLSYFAGSTEFTRSFFGFREPYDYRETECFSNSDAIPDCQQLPPYSNIGKSAKEPEKTEEGVTGGERQVFFPDVNFDFNKATLNDLGKGRVRQISQLLASVPSLKVVVEGHCDFKGTDEYNMKLGEQRAQSVIKELTELGIDPGRLSPLSYGESKSIFTEETDWARAVNRRAQFSVQGAAAAEPAAKPAQ
jgi:peptidoglycan-associated lipoprotein